MIFRPPEYNPEKQKYFDEVARKNEQEKNPIDPNIPIESQEKIFSLYSLDDKKTSLSRFIKTIKDNESNPGLDFQSLQNLLKFIGTVVEKSTQEIVDEEYADRLGDQSDKLMSLLDKGTLYKILILECLQDASYRAGVKKENDANWQREMGDDL